MGISIFYQCAQGMQPGVPRSRWIEETTKTACIESQAQAVKPKASQKIHYVDELENDWAEVYCAGVLLENNPNQSDIGLISKEILVCHYETKKIPTLEK